MKMSNTAPHRTLSFNSAYLASLPLAEARSRIHEWPSIVARDNQDSPGTGPVDYFRNGVEQQEGEASFLTLCYTLAMLGASVRLASEILSNDTAPATPAEFDTILEVNELARTWDDLEQTVNTIYKLHYGKLSNDVDIPATLMDLTKGLSEGQAALDRFPLDGIDSIQQTLKEHEESMPVLALVLYPYVMLRPVISNLSIKTLEVLKNHIGDF